MNAEIASEIDVSDVPQVYERHVFVSIGAQN
jgi:hypothetical protein